MYHPSVIYKQTYMTYTMYIFFLCLCLSIPSSFILPDPIPLRVTDKVNRWLLCHVILKSLHMSRITLWKPFLRNFRHFLIETVTFTDQRTGTESLRDTSFRNGDLPDRRHYTNIEVNVWKNIQVFTSDLPPPFLYFKLLTYFYIYF